MSQTEEELLRDEVFSVFQILALTVDVIEAAERHLGPSNWNIERAAQRAARAFGDRELDAEEMRDVISDMREDLKGALEALRCYSQDENLTRATVMLGFMVHSSIRRIETTLDQ